MAVLTFPDILPNNSSWGYKANSEASTSPLDSSTQTAERAGRRWGGVVQYSNLNQDDSRVMMAFLSQLGGLSGRFYMYDHTLPAPRGVATGTPLVNGASQTGKSLVTDGWTVSTTGILKVGDYIGVNNELRMIVGADIDSDVGGNATLTLDAPLRASPADNAVITVTKPTAIMRLVRDDPSWRNAPPYNSSYTIEFVESFV